MFDDRTGKMVVVRENPDRLAAIKMAAAGFVCLREAQFS